jgi:hypothetical protein
MPRNQQNANEEGAFQRVTGAVKRLFGRGRSSEKRTAEPAPGAAAPRQSRPKADHAQARPAKRETDIPLDVIGNAYTPQATSSKSGFRSDGADHQRDQEFSRGVADDRWNDEDHFTNKSGDPRIGTHRRTYEPGENRAESRD